MRCIIIIISRIIIFILLIIMIYILIMMIHSDQFELKRCRAPNCFASLCVLAQAEVHLIMTMMIMMMIMMTVMMMAMMITMIRRGFVRPSSPHPHRRPRHAPPHPSQPSLERYEQIKETYSKNTKFDRILSLLGYTMHEQPTPRSNTINQKELSFPKTFVITQVSQKQFCYASPPPEGKFGTAWPGLVGTEAPTVRRRVAACGTSSGRPADKDSCPVLPLPAYPTTAWFRLQG